jgi:hypothetical protein
VKNNEMKEWLQKVTQTPLPLKLFARVVIRKLIGRDLDAAVHTLPLPVQLINFLLYDDLKSFVKCPNFCRNFEESDSESEGDDVAMISSPLRD